MHSADDDLAGCVDMSVLLRTWVVQANHIVPSLMKPNSDPRIQNPTHARSICTPVRTTMAQPPPHWPTLHATQADAGTGTARPGLPDIYSNFLPSRMLGIR